MRNKRYFGVLSGEIVVMAKTSEEALKKITEVIVSGDVSRWVSTVGHYQSTRDGFIKYIDLTRVIDY